MRFATCSIGGREALLVSTKDGLRGLHADDPAFPGSLDRLVRNGEADFGRVFAALSKGALFPEKDVTFKTPITPGKIICIGLNYADHTAESKLEQPKYPTVFARFLTSLAAHGAPIVKPKVSDQLDYEGELVAVIGKAGRNIAKANALDHVAGYSIFNDGSVRDFQTKSPQWTVGKNFDRTGSFGPFFVPASELPAGAAGLKIETRLNGVVMQSSSISHLIFDVATLVSTLSEAITLEPGDIIVTGTPAGVGAARKPPVFMKAGDRCEVQIESIGTLVNVIENE